MKDPLPATPKMLPVRRLILLLPLLIGCALTGQAAIKPVHLFSDHMVLQREMPLPVWGSADPGEPVRISFAGQDKSVLADANGQWRVVLEPLKLNAQPTQMRISGKDSSVTLTDVLVGDVFQCSGQSNMAMSMSACLRQPGTKEDIANTNLPLVRMFSVPTGVFAAEPQQDVNASWVAFSPEQNARFAAVPFYFAKSLYDHLKIPMGIVRASHAGGAIEIKMSKEALQSTEEGGAGYEAGLRRCTPEALAARKKLIQERYEASLKEALALGATAPPPPKEQSNIDGGYPCGDWNQSIAPVIGYAKKAVVWYQGEHNAGNALSYRALLPSLIRGWREAYGLGSLPFVVIQLPAYGGDEAERSWALLRESQWVGQRSAPDTALVVTIDHGEKDNIHPADKREVGRRAALEIRRLVYAENVTGCGPLYKAFRVQGHAVVLEFDTGGHGLKSATGPELASFAIAGADRHFVPANAVIAEDKVIVSSPSVAEPVAVRYAWSGFPKASLFDDQGLPAGPFRTDAW